MAEVSNDLLYEVLKNIQTRLDKVETGLGEVKSELISIRGHTIAVQPDMHNIYGILSRQDDRLERIERRLELREFAESQQPFDPKP